MKAPSVLALALSACLGAMVSAQKTSVIPYRVQQPLLGVGNNPPSSTPSGADAFFDDGALQEIRLAINSRDWETLKSNYLDNTYYPTDFRWRDQVVRNVGIRSRGIGSRSGIKPGLRIDFDRYTSNEKFLGLKSFVLRNNTQDASNMHERISMLLFKRLNLPAPREAHTRLYVNDAYAGLFTIVESIDKSFLNRTFGEDTGYLYKYDIRPTARRTGSPTRAPTRASTCRCRSSPRRTKPTPSRNSSCSSCRPSTRPALPCSRRRWANT